MSGYYDACTCGPQILRPCIEPRCPSRRPLTYTPVPVGCICPAGANKDCERLDCPRKAVRS